MKRIGLLLILIVLLVKCSDVVTDNYKTYNDALKDDLFGSGWLPEFIPSSSFSITTSHNLDLNTSEGEFSFPPSASESFTTRLLPYSGRKSSYFDFDKLLNKRKAQGYALYEYSRDNCVWVFFVNREKGHAYYHLWPG
jgi:hypothetical protein